jgi:3-phosphoglycerate kinase
MPLLLLLMLQLLLLENVRFYKEEEKNVAEFAQKVRSTATS